MKKSEMKEFKELLLSLRARLRGDVEQLTAEALSGSEGNGDAKSPTHLAELGTDAYEQDFSLRFVESDQEILVAGSLSHMSPLVAGTAHASPRAWEFVSDRLGR